MNTLQTYVVDEIIDFFELDTDEANAIHVQPAARNAFTVTLDMPRLYNWPADYIERTGSVAGVQFVAPNTHQLVVVPTH